MNTPQVITNDTNKWPFSLIRSIIIFGLYSQQIFGIGTKNNLDTRTLKMLDPKSRENFNEGIFEINLNILLGRTNYVNAIIHLFFAIEQEFSASIVQYMRWLGGAKMPRDYNCHTPKIKIYFTGKDKKRRINFNKLIKILEQHQWQAPTIGEALNCFEEICEKYKIQYFPQGNEMFIKDCRKLIDIANHMRHFQYGLVSYQEAIEFKDALERFFYLYMPTINKFKQTLRGDFGDDIGTPPNLNFKIDILDLDCFNRLKFQTMIEIYSSSAT